MKIILWCLIIDTPVPIIELEHHIANPFGLKIEEVVKKLKYPQPAPIKSCLCTLNFNCEVATALEL